MQLSLDGALKRQRTPAIGAGQMVSRAAQKDNTTNCARRLDFYQRAASALALSRTAY